MKQIILFVLLFILSVTCAEGAGVKLDSLKQFDITTHSVAVNIEAEVQGECYIDTPNIREAFEVLLTRFGFQVAPMNESHLEFAVSIKGFGVSGPQPCGIKVLSMVRQIPKIKMLRISPGSSTTRYRVWTTENVVTASQDDIQSILQDQARKDVVEFARACRRPDG